MVHAYLSSFKVSQMWTVFNEHIIRQERKKRRFILSSDWLISFRFGFWNYPRWNTYFTWTQDPVPLVFIQLLEWVWSIILISSQTIASLNRKKENPCRFFCFIFGAETSLFTHDATLRGNQSKRHMEMGISSFHHFEENSDKGKNDSGIPLCWWFMHSSIS